MFPSWFPVHDGPQHDPGGLCLGIVGLVLLVSKFQGQGPDRFLGQPLKKTAANPAGGRASPAQGSGQGE